LAYPELQATRTRTARRSRLGANVMKSREKAVDLVFKGGSLGLLGLGAGIGGSVLGVGHWALYAGAGLAAGSGFWMVSRAAKHLWQYGSRLGATILGAFTGLGAMAMMWSLGQALLSLGLFAPGTVLSSLGLVGGIGATVWILGMVILALVRLMSAERELD
jgi:hypothetical protein